MRRTIESLKAYIRDHEQGQKARSAEDNQGTMKDQAYIKDLMKCLSLKAKWYERKQLVYEQAASSLIDQKDGHSSQSGRSSTDENHQNNVQAVEQSHNGEEVEPDQGVEKSEERVPALDMVEDLTLL